MFLPNCQGAHKAISFEPGPGQEKDLQARIAAETAQPLGTRDTADLVLPGVTSQYGCCLGPPRSQDERIRAWAPKVLGQVIFSFEKKHLVCHWFLLEISCSIRAHPGMRQSELLVVNNSSVTTRLLCIAVAFLWARAGIRAL